MDIVKYRIELVKQDTKTFDILEKKIKCPENVYVIIKEYLHISKLAEEIFGILCLTTKMKITSIFIVSHGGLDSCLVHPREVFKRAMLVNPSSIILFHNHPSGDVTPSKEDVNVTNRLCDAGNLLGIKVLDHIISGDEVYYSFKEMGQIQENKFIY